MNANEKINLNNYFLQNLVFKCFELDGFKAFLNLCLQTEIRSCEEQLRRKFPCYFSGIRDVY